jgi:tRNA (cytidine/uridine-2'-O-)-methyltransferase
MNLAEPNLHIVLVRPEIPQNTGSIARLAAAIRARLHLIGPLGFSLDDRYLKRAGLDYWPLVDLHRYEAWEQFTAMHPDSPHSRSKFFSTHGPTSYLNAQYKRGDFLFFGGETKGLGKEFLSERSDRAYRIPIFEAGVRSLNLSNAVSIVTYEALRQIGALSSS